MEKAVQFQCPTTLISKATSSFNSSNGGKTEVSMGTSFVLKPSNISPLNPINSLTPISCLRRAHIGRTVPCAWNKRRRSGSQKTKQFILESAAYFIASNLKIVPEPLDLLIREFVGGSGGGGGGGGGLGFWKGSGWGGFDGWRRRKRTNRLGIVWWFLITLCGGLGFLLLIQGKGKGSHNLVAALGALVTSSILGLSIATWRKDPKDWILGFCCCALLVGLGLKNEQDLKNWAKGTNTTRVLGTMIGRRKR